MEASIYSVVYSVDCQNESEAKNFAVYLNKGDSPEYIIDSWDDGRRVGVEVLVKECALGNAGLHGEVLVSKLIDKYKEE